MSHAQLFNYKEIHFYDQIPAVHARLQVLSHQFQSPFRFLRKESAPFAVLDTLAKTPSFRYRFGHRVSSAFFSSTGRPAKNQPQILRASLLFLLLLQGLTKPSLTLWLKRLKSNRVLAALIVCTTDSLPPPGSYFDFKERLWTVPVTGHYARNKLLPAP